MSSEKVKEIKEALECCKQNEIEETCGYCLVCPASNWDYEKECTIDLFQKTLTLINELESENERLKIQLAQANAGIVNCSGCKFVEINAVREFAERLKDKVKNFCGTEEENHYYDVSKEGACEEIDETLKEYEK